MPKRHCLVQNIATACTHNALLHSQCKLLNTASIIKRSALEFRSSSTTTPCTLKCILDAWLTAVYRNSPLISSNARPRSCCGARFCCFEMRRMFIGKTNIIIHACERQLLRTHVNISIYVHQTYKYADTRPCVIVACVKCEMTKCRSFTTPLHDFYPFGRMQFAWRITQKAPPLTRPCARCCEAEARFMALDDDAWIVPWLCAFRSHSRQTTQDTQRGIMTTHVLRELSARCVVCVFLCSHLGLYIYTYVYIYMNVWRVFICTFILFFNILLWLSSGAAASQSLVATPLCLPDTTWLNCVCLCVCVCSLDRCCAACGRREAHLLVHANPKPATATPTNTLSSMLCCVMLCVGVESLVRVCCLHGLNEWRRWVVLVCVVLWQAYRRI